MEQTTLYSPEVRMLPAGLFQDHRLRYLAKIQVPTSPTPVNNVPGAFIHSEGITDVYLRHGGKTRLGFCSTDFALVSQVASQWQEAKSKCSM